MKNWSDQLDPWLSVAARPGKNKQRHFDDEDLRVFSLAQEILGKGGKYDEVKAALANGSRGELPETSLTLVPSAVSGQVLALRDTVQMMGAEIKRLQSALDEQRGRDRLLEEKLVAAESKIEKLNREIGRLETGKGSE
ncbi:MAG: hypothetical protein H0X30_17825 [Anaerolineae bacterium]|nr:hypothetical protein [Anaerolineae bacterium]